MQEPTTNTNTILIVMVIIIIVAFGAYWYTHRAPAAPAQDTSGVQINLGGNSNTPAPADK